jgi:hypothetical protein
MFHELIDRIARKSPVTVMARTLLENIFSPDKLNAVFNNNRQAQRNRKWLFSSVVGLMLLVVCKIRPSIRAAYRSYVEETSASLASFYDKINGLNLSVSEALVRETASDMRQITAGFSNPKREIITGYRNRIVDGSKIAATDRRPKVLREQEGSPLRGLVLLFMNRNVNLLQKQYYVRMDMLRNVPCFHDYWSWSSRMIYGLRTGIFVVGIIFPVLLKRTVFS